jgi:hypothetical protein
MLISIKITTMLKNIFPLIFFVLVIFSCDQLAPKSTSETKEEEPYHKVTYHSNGKLRTDVHLDSSGRYHGEAKKFYESGQLKSQTTYQHGVIQYAKQYHENGNLEMEFPYKNGKKNGLRKKYWENGQLQSQMTYVNGEPKADLIEYDKSGEKVTTYPDLVIKQIDNIDKTGQYILQAYFSSNPQKGTYYLGELKNGVLETYTPRMAKNGKIGEEIYRPAPGTFFMKKINIIGKFMTGYGNIRIVEKEVNLAFSN